MFYKRKFRMILLAAALALLLSILAGRFIAAPYLGAKVDTAEEFGLGFILVLAAAELFNIAGGLIYNGMKKAAITAGLPDSEEELSKMGISTPLDYAFAMSRMMEYNRIPVVNSFEALDTERQVLSVKSIGKSMLLFRETFGRKPEFHTSLNWDVISVGEAARMLGKEPTDITMEDVFGNVSPEVLARFNIVKCGTDSGRAA